jgi:hypothetical protein
MEKGVAARARAALMERARMAVNLVFISLVVLVCFITPS